MILVLEYGCGGGVVISNSDATYVGFSSHVIVLARTLISSEQEVKGLTRWDCDIVSCERLGVASI